MTPDALRDAALAQLASALGRVVAIELARLPAAHQAEFKESIFAHGCGVDVDMHLWPFRVRIRAAEETLFDSGEVYFS